MPRFTRKFGRLEVVGRGPSTAGRTATGRRATRRFRAGEVELVDDVRAAARRGYGRALLSSRRRGARAVRAVGLSRLLYRARSPVEKWSPHCDAAIAPSRPTAPPPQLARLIAVPWPEGVTGRARFKGYSQVGSVHVGIEHAEFRCTGFFGSPLRVPHAPSKVCWSFGESAHDLWLRIANVKSVAGVELPRNGVDRRRGVGGTRCCPEDGLWLRRDWRASVRESLQLVSGRGSGRSSPGYGGRLPADVDAEPTWFSKASHPPRRTFAG